MKAKTALITGITGQDGTYLARFLLEKNYNVVGLTRHTSSGEMQLHRLEWMGLVGKIKIVDGDLLDLGAFNASCRRKNRTRFTISRRSPSYTHRFASRA